MCVDCNVEVGKLKVALPTNIICSSSRDYRCVRRPARCGKILSRVCCLLASIDHLLHGACFLMACHSQLSESVEATITRKEGKEGEGRKKRSWDQRKSIHLTLRISGDLDGYPWVVYLCSALSVTSSFFLRFRSDEFSELKWNVVQDPYSSSDPSLFWMWYSVKIVVCLLSSCFYKRLFAFLRWCREGYWLSASLPNSVLCCTREWTYAASAQWICVCLKLLPAEVSDSGIRKFLLSLLFPVARRDWWA